MCLIVCRASTGCVNLIAELTAVVDVDKDTEATFWLLVESDGFSRWLVTGGLLEPGQGLSLGLCLWTVPTSRWCWQTV